MNFTSKDTVIFVKKQGLMLRAYTSYAEKIEC